MLTLPTSLRVFAKTGPTDMRKSFEGLVGVVERELGQQVESGDLFLFFNRRGDRVKVLWFAGDGLVIWYKRLEGGTFEVPRSLPSINHQPCAPGRHNGWTSQFACDVAGRVGAGVE
jgi:transposase